MTVPAGLSTSISSNRHQPEQVPVIVTYCPDTEYIGSVIVPALSALSAPAVTGWDASVAGPDVPAGAQLWPVMPVSWGGQDAAAAPASSGQSTPLIWSEWVTRTTEPMVAADPRLMVTLNGPPSEFQPMAPLQSQVPDGETWPSVSLPAYQPVQVGWESAWAPDTATPGEPEEVAPLLPLATVGGSS